MKDAPVKHRFELLPGWVLALLYFFGCADLVFATRIHAMNFRWGQLILIVCAVMSIGPLLGLLKHADMRGPLVRILGAWALFFAALVAAALHSEQRGPSFVKLAWAVLNITGAAVVCLAGVRRKSVLLEACAVATGLTSLIIWADSIWMFCGGLPGPVLGLAQQGWMWNEFQPMRPHAYYYEPSYAGAMLAFATPVLFVATRTLPRWTQIVLPALSMSAVILVGSRTGFAGLALSLGISFAWAIVGRHRAELRRIALSTGVGVVLLTTFFMSAPRASEYAAYLVGPLGLTATARRLVHRNTHKIDAGTSEGSRLASAVDGLKRWTQHPILGWGVNNGAVRARGRGEADRAIHTGAPNTWVEVIVESGLLGILTFLLALGLGLREVFRTRSELPFWGCLIAGCVTHLVVNLNTTQTYPRLDYWLLFFCVVRAAMPEPAAQPADVPVSSVEAPSGDSARAAMAPVSAA